MAIPDVDCRRIESIIGDQHAPPKLHVASIAMT
jgi:hypothetical protein